MCATFDTIRVLLVDEPAVADETASALEREDERLCVETVSSAHDGLTRLAETAVDCIISEYDLPDRNGLTFLNSVRSEYPTLPFVLYTDGGSEALASEAIATGVTDYLPKDGAADDQSVLSRRVVDAVRGNGSWTGADRDQRLREIIDALPHLLYVVDEDGRYRLANEALASFHDTTVDAIEGAHMTDMLDSTVAEQFHQEFQDVIESGTPKRMSELEVVDSDGETHTFEPRLLPYEFGGTDTRAVLGIATDITDRKEREARLESLNETTNEMMSADTREAVVDIGIKAARDVLGLAANAIHLYEEESGLVPVAATDPLHDLIGDPPTFTGDDSIAWRVYEEGNMLALDDVHDDSDVHNPDTPVKSELYLPIENYGILIAGSPTPKAFDQQDLILGDILVRNVATALEQIEKQDRLRAREQELAYQNERLEEFASVVSHDLRNPLNVAQGRVSLAQERRDSDNLAAAERALDRMENLIEDLLTLAREGDETCETESIRFDTLVQNCWETVETRDATLEIDVDHSIQADRGRLRQLLENLMRNAVDHSDGPVTLTVGALPDGYYIEDDGPGIPEDARADVFETGYSTSESGTGFGLSIVQQVAETHEWDVTITDSSDGGARFEITGVEWSECATGCKSSSSPQKDDKTS